MAVDEAEVEVQEPEPDASAPDGDATGKWQCPACGKLLSARPQHVRRHLKDVHGIEAPGKAPAAPAPRGRPRKAGRTQQGLTLAYGLGMMAFGAFGPPPAEARQRVAMAGQLTATQTGAALDRGLRKTPLYPLVAAVFGVGAFLDDLAPAALPLVVGVYNYAPPLAQARIRPMARTLAGQVLHQAFGDAPPELAEVTPVAIPAWIRELTDHLFPEPSFDGVTTDAGSGGGP